MSSLNDNEYNNNDYADLEMNYQVQSYNTILCNFFFYVSLIFVFVLFVLYALYNLLTNFINMQDHVMKLIT